MKRHITFALLFAAALTAQAQQGGISSEMLNQIKQSYQATPTDKAIRNALGGTSINTLALNQENQADFDTHFSNKVLSKGITDQRSSGRCWLFTGLNVLRSQMIWSFRRTTASFMTSWKNRIFSYRESLIRVKSRWMTRWWSGSLSIP